MSNPLKWELHRSNSHLVVFTPDQYGYHLHQEPSGKGWYVNAFSPMPLECTPCYGMVELKGKDMFEAMRKAQEHYDRRHALMVVTQESARSNVIASQEQPLLQGCIAQVVSL